MTTLLPPQESGCLCNYKLVKAVAAVHQPGEPDSALFTGLTQLRCVSSLQLMWGNRFQPKHTEFPRSSPNNGVVSLRTLQRVLNLNTTVGAERGMDGICERLLAQSQRQS